MSTFYFDVISHLKINTRCSSRCTYKCTTHLTLFLVCYVGFGLVSNPFVELILIS